MAAVRPIVCSVVFGHRPWLPASLERDIQRCRCGRVEMTRMEALTWWPSTPCWQRRRWRKMRHVALWRSLRRRQFGSDFDRDETAFLIKQEVWRREDAQRLRAQTLARAAFSLSKPGANAVITGLTS